VVISPPSIADQEQGALAFLREQSMELLMFAAVFYAWKPRRLTTPLLISGTLTGSLVA
jgi:hypothetical protein